jgi:hypothetical protein
MGWGCSGRGEGIGGGWRFRCGGSGCIWTIETPFCLQFLYLVVGACAFYCLLGVLLGEVAVTRGNETWCGVQLSRGLGLLHHGQLQYQTRMNKENY